MSTLAILGFVTHLTILITCIFGNSIIIAAIIKHRNFRTPYHNYLLNISISDITMIILSLGFLFENINTNGYIFGTAICKVQGTFIEMTYTISVWSLVGANFERFIAICKPMERMSRTTKKAALSCAGIWLLAFAVCSPLLDAYDVRRVNGTSGAYLDCSHRFKWSHVSLLSFYGVHSLLVFVVPLAYMTSTFVRIVRALYTSERSTQAKLDQNFTCATAHVRVRKKSEEAKLVKMRMRNRKITKILLVVTLVFVVLWCPYLILRLMRYSGLNVSMMVWKVSQLLMITTSTVNFFIYAIMSKEMRKVFWIIVQTSLCCFCCCCCGGGGRRGVDRSSTATFSARSESTRTQRTSTFGEEEFQCRQ